MADDIQNDERKQNNNDDDFADRKVTPMPLLSFLYVEYSILPYVSIS